MGKKTAQKVDFRNFLDPFWGFTLKTVLGIHDPRISWLLFGNKNHEIRGPPVVRYRKVIIMSRQTVTKLIILGLNLGRFYLCL